MKNYIYIMFIIADTGWGTQKHDVLYKEIFCASDDLIKIAEYMFQKTGIELPQSVIIKDHSLSDNDLYLIWEKPYGKYDNEFHMGEPGYQLVLQELL